MHRAVALLLFAVLAAAAALAVPAARGASSDLVVSQVFAGGGNSGAPYANDFVELFNRGSTAVDVSGWTVQYASATGTTWQVTALTGSIAPGRHYLVQLASGGTVGAALPAPDATGTSNLAVSGGKVAVARSTAALACGATAGSCSAVTSVADLVGYGTASDYEGGAAAAAIDNTTAATRGSGGCDDADANSADFASAAAAPRNSSSAILTCGSEPPPTGGVSQSATVDVDIQSDPLDLARATRRQLRERDDRQHPRARVGTRDGDEQQRERVRGDRPPDGLPARRPAARRRRHRSERRADRSRTGRRRDGRDPDRPCRGPARGHDRSPERCRRRPLGYPRRFRRAAALVPAGRYTATVTFTVIGR